MPIDFAAVAARYAAAFALQLRVVTVQQAIGSALERRQEAAKLVDLATESFPIVRFFNGAVTLWLPPGQRGSLTPAAPPRSFLDHLAEGAGGFLDGLGRAIAPLRGTSQETAIARFLTAAERALADIETSVRRFRTPSPRMFDPDSRNASDLFGLLGLAVRVLGEASTTSGAVRRLAGQLRAAITAVGMPLPDKVFRVLGPPAGGEPPPAARTLAETADALARNALAAIVLVGSLPSLIDWLLTDGAVALRLWVLDAFEKVERQLYRLRGTAFEVVFGGGTGLVQRGVLLAGAIQKVLGANVEFQLKFYRAYGVQFATGVRDFVIGLGEFLKDVVSLLQAIPGLLQAITRFGLDELLRAKLGWAAHLVPNLRLDDLLDADGFAVNTGLRDNLVDALNAADRLLDDLDRNLPVLEFTEGYRYGKRQIARGRRLVQGLFTGGGAGAAVPVLTEGPPLDFRSDFPDLGKMLFGEGRDQQYVAAVTRLEHAAVIANEKVFRRVSRGMYALADRFTAESARAAKADEKGRLAGLGEQADRVAESFYGPEVAAQRKAVQQRPRDPMAHAFEAWLASTSSTGGFLLIGEVIPAYAGELAAAWRAQLAEGTELTAELTPTSPHILRKRAVLGRVRVPRLTLRAAPGRALDQRFAGEVADLFGDVTRDAYLTGQRRVRELAELGSGEQR
ncbi:hypothetical protein ACQPXM_17690 [Kribbella sp. CA-253562]|uniref:hypothetical protein n=1 Tax=Kribbella sp. CA-253562 TaxID=3239942 RepID=UPI003D8C1863